MRSSEAYNRMEAAVTDGNVADAVDAAKTSAGFAGSSRDTAERNMRDAAVGAGTNSENASYGANETSAERRARETEAKYANERALKTPTKDEILKKYSLQFSRQNKVSYGVALSQFQDKYGMRGDSLPQSILKQYGYTGKSFKNAGARGSLF